MTETLLRILVAVAVYGGVVQEGYAPRYAPTVMERVAYRRGMAVEGCMVSSPVYDVGTRLIVYGRNTDRALSCVVTDVSHPQHRAGHIARKLWVELGYASARALCGHLSEPAVKCPVVVVRF